MDARTRMMLITPAIIGQAAGRVRPNSAIPTGPAAATDHGIPHMRAEAAASKILSQRAAPDFSTASPSIERNPNTRRFSMPLKRASENTGGLPSLEAVIIIIVGVGIHFAS
jgi:hypothetical protein